MHSSYQHTNESGAYADTDNHDYISVHAIVHCVHALTIAYIVTVP